MREQYGIQGHLFLWCSNRGRPFSNNHWYIYFMHKKKQGQKPPIMTDFSSSAILKISYISDITLMYFLNLINCFIHCMGSHLWLPFFI